MLNKTNSRLSESEKQSYDHYSKQNYGEREQARRKEGENERLEWKRFTRHKTPMEFQICCYYHKNENHEKKRSYSSNIVYFIFPFFQEIGDEEKKLAIGNETFSFPFNNYIQSTLISRLKNIRDRRDH